VVEAATAVIIKRRRRIVFESTRRLAYRAAWRRVATIRVPGRWHRYELETAVRVTAATVELRTLPIAAKSDPCVHKQCRDARLR
jgi:hypothetical protein